MRLELEMSLELFFQENWSKLSFILFLCFMCYSFIYDIETTFVAFQFVHQMTQKKSLSLVKEWGNMKKMFNDDRYIFFCWWAILPYISNSTLV